MPRLPFLPLMEEKEAKEDQGDDRHQVGRIGVWGYWGLHEVRLNRRGELFWPAWDASGWVRGVVWAFIGSGRMDTENFLGFRGVCLDGCGD